MATRQSVSDEQDDVEDQAEGWFSGDDLYMVTDPTGANDEGSIYSDTTDPMSEIANVSDDSTLRSPSP